MRYLIALILCIVLICGCSPIKAPTSQFNKYEIKSVNLTNADLIFYFDIENPNDIPLGIKDINYSVDLDGSNVVEGNYDGFDIQGKEKKMISLPIKIEYAKLAGQAFGLAKKFITRTGSIKYKIAGDLDIVDNVGFSSNVPLGAEGEINLF
jgi:LEA14-like dessication related protein